MPEMTEGERVMLRMMGAPDSCCACPDLLLNHEGVPSCNLPGKRPRSVGNNAVINGGMIVSRCSREGELDAWAERRVRTEEFEALTEGMAEEVYEE